MQSFGCGDPGTPLPVDEEGLARKRAAIAAHATQAAVIRLFDERSERIRPAPAHAFDRLPNGGALWYANFPWGLDGAGWLAAVARAREAMPCA